MEYHQHVDSVKLHALIRKGEIRWAGNLKLKIFGTLRCSSGRRMKKENRVFFKDSAEALAAGFRPCGRCMPSDYKAYKVQTYFYIPTFVGTSFYI